MALSIPQRLLLYGPPLIILAALAVVWLTTEYICGNLAWLFPILDRPMPTTNEIVMTPSMRIDVTSPTGEVTITASKGRERTFSWEGGMRSIELWPRTDRWNGSFGAYFPGPGRHWFPHHGIYRCVMDEGQLNFSSEAKALKFLAEAPAFEPRIYRNDGLTVWLSKNGGTLGVDIYQIYVNGKKPRKLIGAQDDKIAVTSTDTIPVETDAPEDSTEAQFH